MSFFRKLFGGKKQEETPAPDPEPAQKAAPPPPPPQDLSKADQPIDCTGIDWNAESQLAFLKEVLAERAAEVAPRLEEDEFKGNEWCSPVDAGVLYAMAAHYEPGRIMEVGCGYTTWVLRLAKEMAGLPGELIAVDPEPRILVGELVDAQLFQAVEELPVDDFKLLQEGEFAIFDLPHVYLDGGPLDYVYNQVLPSLEPGTIVGFHGVRLPKHYRREELEQGFNDEDHLLKFLSGENAPEVLFAGAWLWENHREALEAALPASMRGAAPTALWVRKRA